MARDLPEILPDLLEDGYSIKAEAGNIISKNKKTIKIKKVYPRLLDVWGKKDTPYYIIVLLFPALSNQ